MFTSGVDVELSAKTLWPLFPLLLVVVVVCLVWAMVVVIRQNHDRKAIWYQGGALLCYVLAAVSAVASESGRMSANVHRPFSLLTQLFIALSLYQAWGQDKRKLLILNIVAWAAILVDTALHFILVR